MIVALSSGSDYSITVNGDESMFMTSVDYNGTIPISIKISNKITGSIWSRVFPVGMGSESLPVDFPIVLNEEGGCMPAPEVKVEFA